MMRHGHVPDERLIEVSLDPSTATAEDAHLASCEACAERRAAIERLLQEVADAATAEADAAFPAERLAAQHARILQRIEQDGRPARVITFPAASTSDTRPLRTRPAARWIAGAAAAGLAIGLLAGHLVHDLPTIGRPSRPALVSGAARPNTGTSLTAPRVVNASLNDEAFLSEIETALDGPQLAVLQPLNDLTPR